MLRQNLNFETQAKRHEGKSKVVSQIGPRGARATTCVKKFIAWLCDIRF